MPTVWGTCRLGHVSKPLLVKRYNDEAALVQCTHVSKRTKKQCDEQYLMFDERIILYHEAEYQPPQGDD